MATPPTSNHTLERVKARLAELRKRDARSRISAAPSETVPWPRDLNANDDVVDVGWGAGSAEGT